MIYICASAVLVAFLAGLWAGKKLTVRRFHKLQDEGELVVLTAEQFKNVNQLRSLMGEGGGEADDEDEGESPYSEVTYNRRDSEERRSDWATSIKRGDPRK